MVHLKANNNSCPRNRQYAKSGKAPSSTQYAYAIHNTQQKSQRVLHTTIRNTQCTTEVTASFQSAIRNTQYATEVTSDCANTQKASKYAVLQYAA